MADMRQLTVHIRGTSPLMMHNIEAANPTSDHARKLKAIHAKKKRKGVDVDEVMEEYILAEWDAGIYHDPAVGPYIGGHMLAACVQEGARLSKGGKEVDRAVSFPSRTPLMYEGPRDLATLRASEKFRDCRMVRVGQAMVLRTRPVFPAWELKFTLAFNAAGTSAENLIKYIADAGSFCGLGTGRAKLGCGRFEIVSAS